MNPLQIAAMLDKIKAAGGTVKLVDGKPIARNVPDEYLIWLKATRDGVIRALSGHKPAPTNHTRASVDWILSTGRSGTVSGDDSDTTDTLLAVLLEKWPSELVRASVNGEVVYQA
jgi:hypothetical protein